MERKTTRLALKVCNKAKRNDGDYQRKFENISRGNDRSIKSLGARSIKRPRKITTSFPYNFVVMIDGYWID